MLTPIMHPEVVPVYAAFTNQGFLLAEVSEAAELILAGRDAQEVRTLILDDDLFQLSALPSRKTIATAVLNRLQDVNETLLTFLVEGSLELRKLTNLYLILLKHRLLREFLAEVVREELARFSFTLTKGDANAFFERKQLQVPELEAWTEQTMYKSKRNVLSILEDAGLLQSQEQGDYTIQAQYLPTALRQELKAHQREAFLKLMLDQGDTDV